MTRRTCAILAAIRRAQSTGEVAAAIADGLSGNYAIDSAVLSRIEFAVQLAAVNPEPKP